MCSAALQYARRGWPVFPCRERDETRVIGGAGGKTRTFKAKAPYTGNGLKDATTDEQRILAWWREHPEALIGLPTGANGCFVLDFDPRVEEEVDPDTGEVTGRREWTLEQLKTDLEAQMGCALPRSVTAVTQSGGVHVYFRQPAGEPIRNRGNLPEHVDVRGLGGYVIAPPSVLPETGARYRWFDRGGDWRDDAAIADAPAQLVDILRASKAKARDRSAGAGEEIADERPVRRASLPAGDDEAVRRYAMRALDHECSELAATPIGGGRHGGRNNGIFAAGLKMGGLVAAGAISLGVVRAALLDVIDRMPGNQDPDGAHRTLENGLSRGQENPRDLAEVAASSRARQERAPSRGTPAATAQPSRGGDFSQPFHNGGHPLTDLGEAEADRLKRVARAWLVRRLEHLEPSRDTLSKLAFGVGRRIAAGLLDEESARVLLAAPAETVADLTPADLDRALDDGYARGFDLEPLLLAMRCAGHPLTPFGIAERFRDRFGHDFRFTTAKGWVGWDTRRWKVLDQDEKTPPAEVIAAVFDTIRSLQDEARLIGDTGVRWRLIDRIGPRGGEQQELDLYDDQNPHGLDRWIMKGKGFVLFSDTVRAFGRASETTGMPAAVAALARRWLTVPIEQFDRDPFAVNVMNGTLRFRCEEAPDGARRGTVELADHCREDLQTKLSPVVYDPAAPAPRYDKMFAWAQPDAPMRRYLHQLGGYALTGDAGEQKLWFWYGRGRNGKGTTLDVWQHVAGDYADTIPIGSFLDQGIKKRGDQASPDLAKLGGVRLLRSSEPGRNEKLDSALIKLVTGGDPLPVRMLHRGFFNLQPLFKLIIMGNTRFDIPDTDDGIWSRMKLVPWLRNIEKPEAGVADWPEKDPKLPAKIIAEEASGVLNRLVEGLLDYLSHGLVEPQGVTAATEAYRDASDPIARFMRACTVPEAGSRVQSSALHAVFVAWCRVAGESEWKNKGFSTALAEKGYEKKTSNGVWWLDIAMTREVGDFVDDEGRPRTLIEEDGDDRVLDAMGSRPSSDFDDDMPP
jgi:putative DNA primase/helicase